AYHAYGGHHGGWGYSHYRGHRGGWGGPIWGGIGIGLGVGLGSLYYGAPWYPAYPAYSVYPAYPVYPEAIAAPLYEGDVAPRQPARPAPPDPVIYPRSGQSAEQTEADRQACNRWAMTQPSAVADASVFQRATLACMEGRGYTVR
ncbi:MAG: hypothetical protein M3Y67_06700, partial [Pseudomonadota bacterium]|nr:hypothetical protein [Pseudomonadota bacterium]